MVGEGEGGSAIMHKAAVEKELVDQINEGHYTVASDFLFFIFLNR